MSDAASSKTLPDPLADDHAILKIPSTDPSSLPLLHAGSLSALAWLRHGFTTRAGGVSTVYGQPDDLNLGLTPEDDPALVVENRQRAHKAVAAQDPATGWTLIQTRQIHSTTILVLPPKAPRPDAPADGLVTAIPGSMLAVLAADCVPILLADARLRVVAAIHAGWRGTAAGIVASAVQIMQERFGSCPTDLRAAIGPSIGPCCYQVGDEVQRQFHRAFPYAADLFTTDRLNLWEANRRQLLDAGLPSNNITVLAACTACSQPTGRRRFFSHRAEHGHTGRMMGLIGIVPAPGVPSAHPVA